MHRAGLRWRTLIGTPVFNLPLANGDTTKRYTLGKLVVRGDYDVRAAELVEREGGWELPLTWTIRQALGARVRPFLHADRDGRIAWQGHPVTDDLAMLSEPGSYPVAMRLSLPDGEAGEYEVWVGLFHPDRMGHRTSASYPTMPAPIAAFGWARSPSCRASRRRFGGRTGSRT
ncbi:MAG: hypothetical protein M5U09_04630, partial [Gammaproteobacteria bacterium]|nr:hypothetical protein [Gammaproteobacteria bacterium]